MRMGENQLALEHLKALGIPTGARKFGYWIATASVLTELGQGEGAREAAAHAYSGEGERRFR
jgi:hypothetical protein